LADPQGTTASAETQHGASAAPLDPADPRALVGRVLGGGEYVLEALLGHGGAAAVYRARSTARGPVAVKVLTGPAIAEGSATARLFAEHRRLADLRHPNLVPVYGFGQEDGLAYIAMRLADGTLRDRLRAAGGRLDPLLAARLVGQLAAAQQHLHEQGLLHLDTKPANVLLVEGEWPLLADFGIARAAAETADGVDGLVGTPAYMAPEQCLGQPVDARTDQYALAVVAFELLTGQRPFGASSVDELLEQHVAAPPPRPSALDPRLPADVDAVLLRALAKAPQGRFPTVREFADALLAAVGADRRAELDPSAAPRVRRDLALWAIALALSALAARLVLVPVQTGRPPGAPWLAAAAALTLGVCMLVIRRRLAADLTAAAGDWLGRALLGAAAPSEAEAARRTRAAGRLVVALFDAGGALLFALTLTAIGGVLGLPPLVGAAGLLLLCLVRARALLGGETDRLAAGRLLLTRGAAQLVAAAWAGAPAHREAGAGAAAVGERTTATATGRSRLGKAVEQPRHELGHG
jgi:serine/threonine-protein kinase